MVATNPSIFATIWGCEGTINTLPSTGYGLQNSEVISQYCGSNMNATHYALDLNQNGYDNWFLNQSGRLQGNGYLYKKKE